MNAQKNIQRWLTDHQSEFPARLQRWIQAAGHPEEPERAVMMCMEKEWRNLGWSTQWHSLATIDLGQIPAFMVAKPQTATDRLSNLTAIKKGTGGGRSILLNGHVDVVPIGDIEAWDEHPFSGAFKEGRIYGRGSCDMLGGLLAMQLAIEAIQGTDLQLKGDVTIAAVVEEECGGAGSVALMLDGIRADAALIAEPTNCQLYVEQQGSQWFRLTIPGKSAHGGTRDLGVSAIEKAYLVVQCLQQLENTRHVSGYVEGFHRPDGIAYPINIGSIHAGNWPSSVADEAVIEGRFGLMPSQSLQDALDSFELAIRKCNASDEWLRTHPVRVEWFGARWMPYELPNHHPWRNVWRALPSREGRQERAAPWGTDAGWLAHVGNIPVMVYGPGEPKWAHQTNENIPIDMIILAAEEMALAIMEWCIVD